MVIEQKCVFFTKEKYYKLDKQVTCLSSVIVFRALSDYIII